MQTLLFSIGKSTVCARKIPKAVLEIHFRPNEIRNFFTLLFVLLCVRDFFFCIFAWNIQHDRWKAYLNGAARRVFVVVCVLSMAEWVCGCVCVSRFCVTSAIDRCEKPFPLFIIDKWKSKSHKNQLAYYYYYFIFARQEWNQLHLICLSILLATTYFTYESNSVNAN